MLPKNPFVVILIALSLFVCPLFSVDTYPGTLPRETETRAECIKQLPCEPGSKLPHTELCSSYYVCSKDGKSWILNRCSAKKRHSFFSRKTEMCEQSREPVKNCRTICPEKDLPQPSPTKVRRRRTNLRYTHLYLHLTGSLLVISRTT